MAGNTTNARGSYWLTLLTMALVLFPGVASAAWENKGIPGGAVIGLGLSPSDPDTLFATAVAGNAGIWRTLDSGENWVQVLAGTSYDGVAVDPNAATDAVAGVSGGAVERTTDTGASWSATAGGASGYNNWVFAYSASSPGTVYAGAENGANDGILQKSTDGGANWTTITTVGLPGNFDADPGIVSIAVDPTDANTVYVGAQAEGGLNDGLYKSTDGGASWTLLTGFPLTRVDALAIDPVDPQLLYVGTGLGVGDIYRSTDGGASWTKIHDPFGGAGNVAFFTSVPAIAIDPGNRSIIYAAGGAGGLGNPQVIVSTNCGATWSDATDNLPVGSMKRILIDTVNDFVYAFEDVLFGVVYRDAAVTASTGACPTGSGNNPPVAVDDMVNATEDTVFNSATDLDANDTDGDSDPLTVLPGTFPTAQGGSITIAMDGSYTYTPAANFNGNDSVNYTVTDGTANDVGTLTIAVGAVDDPPVAVDDAIIASRNTLFVSTTDLDANDIEVDGEALTVTAETKMTAQMGSITIAMDGSYSYTPAFGYVGNDSVDYTVTDGNTNDTGTLNITVAAGGGVAPVAVDDMENTNEDTVLVSTTDLDANDTDGDLDPLFVTPGTFATAQGGSITILADGSYTYTPLANFNGDDSVDYTVTDGLQNDVGTLTIAVAAVDDPPVAVNDAILATVDTLFNSTTDLDANDQEFDGEALTVIAENDKLTAQGGEIDIAADGSYAYMPPSGFLGNDSVDYTVMDAMNNDTGTLNITVVAAAVGGGGGGGGGGSVVASAASGSGGGGAPVLLLLTLLAGLCAARQALGGEKCR